MKVWCNYQSFKDLSCLVTPGVYREVDLELIARLALSYAFGSIFSYHHWKWFGWRQSLGQRKYSEIYHLQIFWSFAIINLLRQDRFWWILNCLLSILQSSLESTVTYQKNPRNLFQRNPAQNLLTFVKSCLYCSIVAMMSMQFM